MSMARQGSIDDHAAVRRASRTAELLARSRVRRIYWNGIEYGRGPGRYEHDVETAFGKSVDDDEEEAIEHPPFEPHNFFDRGLLGMIMISLIPLAGFIVLYHNQHDSNAGVLEHVTDDDFLSVLTFFFTATVTLVGVGLEALVGLQIVRSMSVTKELVLAWRFAQLLFPLLVTIAVFCQSPFGLLILSLGLWKLGFPEVVGSMLAALLLHDLPFLTRTTYFMNSVFLFIHHVCASYTICGIISGEFEISRHIVSVVMPLIMQHWICLIKYHSMVLYAILELVLEVWFEVEVFRNAQFVPVGPRMSSYVMLAAHWGLFLGGALKLYLKFTAKPASLGSTTTKAVDPNPTIPDEEQHTTEHLDIVSHTPRIWKRTVSRYEETKRHSSTNLKRNNPNTMKRVRKSTPESLNNMVAGPTKAFWATHPPDELPEGDGSEAQDGEE